MQTQKLPETANSEVNFRFSNIFQLHWTHTSLLVKNETEDLAKNHSDYTTFFMRSVLKKIDDSAML